MSKKKFLRVSNLSKSFGGLTALDNISFEIEEGQIYALIGPNGAGKSTLFNCLSGIYTPTDGNISFLDKELVTLPPWNRMDLGIARTFQNVELFSGSTVTYNISLGLHPKIDYSIWRELIWSTKVRKSEKETMEKIAEVAELFGLTDYLDEDVETLPTGLQKLVELARASISNPKLLLLDEPAAGMTINEINLLQDGIKILMKKNPNLSVLLVDHNMNFIMNLAHVVGVLNFGSKIAEGTPQDIQNDSTVIEAYLGEGSHA